MTAYQMGYAARMAKAEAVVARGLNPNRFGAVDFYRWRSGWVDASQAIQGRRAILRRAMAEA